MMKKVIFFTLLISCLAFTLAYAAKGNNSKENSENSSSMLEQIERAVEQQNYCKGNADCEDLIILWKAAAVSDDQIPALINGAREDFARTLRLQKKLCYHICDFAVTQVELRQAKRLLGSDNNIQALSEFALRQPEFTMNGWDYVLRYLCQLGKDKPALRKEIVKFSNKVEKLYDKKTLPVLIPDNLSPSYTLKPNGMICIKITLK